MYADTSRALLLACVIFFMAGINKCAAQCSICRDATAGSAPKARAGLRMAIPVLGIPALLIFTALIGFAWKHGRSSEQEMTADDTKNIGEAND